ncbi:hypothetical protein DFJ73DRAFT_369751 [Zopfochytrium polystomum]|nr:hypothetical protein DFJ73DRAFT_369751 [Zopfochytrium polystomum]
MAPPPTESVSRVRGWFVRKFTMLSPFFLCFARTHTLSRFPSPPCPPRTHSVSNSQTQSSLLHHTHHPQLSAKLTLSVCYAHGSQTALPPPPSTPLGPCTVCTAAGALSKMEKK